jgi:hypothetical protein
MMGLALQRVTLGSLIIALGLRSTARSSPSR